MNDLRSIGDILTANEFDSLVDDMIDNQVTKSPHKLDSIDKVMQATDMMIGVIDEEIKKLNLKKHKLEQHKKLIKEKEEKDAS